jgi:hypothetical protein
MKKLIIISAVALFVFGCSHECEVFPNIKVTGYLENFDNPLRSFDSRLFYRIENINASNVNGFSFSNEAEYHSSSRNNFLSRVFNTVRSGEYTLVAFFAHNNDIDVFTAVKQITVGRNDQHIRLVLMDGDVNRQVLR